MSESQHADWLAVLAEDDGAYLAVLCSVVPLRIRLFQRIIHWVVFSAFFAVL